MSYNGAPELSKDYYFIICVAPLQLSAQLELWEEEVRHVELSVDVTQAELFLQRHSDSVLHMHNCVFDVMQMGHDLAQVCSLDL